MGRQHRRRKTDREWGLENLISSKMNISQMNTRGKKKTVPLVPLRGTERHPRLTLSRPDHSYLHSFHLERADSAQGAKAALRIPENHGLRHKVSE